MIRATLLILTFFLFSLFFYCVVPSISHSEPVVKEIDSEADARELAVMSEGTYIKGASVPELSGSEVALPIIDETSGQVLGHIVADQVKLISVLNDVGLTEVATAIAAVSVGTATGTAASTGFALGTVGTVAAVAAVGTGVILLVSSGKSNSTPDHP